MRTENIKIQNSLQDNHIEPESQSSFDIFRKKLIIASVIILLFFAYSDKIWAQMESLYNSSTEQFAGISTLMSATANNDVDGVKFFSKAGALVINQRNKGGATSLHIACREGNFEIAKTLIDNGANVNIIDNEGWTPLMRASLSGNKEIVEILLKNGAKASLLNSLNESALIHATTSKCTKCIEQIIENGDLIKNMEILVLKSQIADAFLIARSQESKASQGVLESFLDYASRMAPLVARNPSINDQESLPLSLNQNKISNSKLNKFSKNFILKNQDNEKLTPEQQSVYSVLEDPNLPPLSNKYANKKESDYQLPQISQQDIPLIQTQEPKTKYKLKSTANNDIAKQNELVPALTVNNTNNKKPIYNTPAPIQEKTFTNQQISKPEAKKFKFKTGQQSLISSDIKDSKSSDSGAIKVQDLTSESKSIPNLDSQAPSAVELKKNKITFIPNSKEKNQEDTAPEETIFLIKKKLNKNDKNSMHEKPLADHKNEEVNEQMNQDFESSESPNEAVNKPNKVFKFKKSSNPQIINSNIESDSIKLAPLKKKESLPLLDESSQKTSEDKGSTIKKFKLKKSNNSIAPIKDDPSTIPVQDLTSDPKSIPSLDKPSPSAVELKKNKITFVPNSKEKSQEIAPQETIFLIEKKSNKNNKNPVNEKPIADLKNEEINQQMNQDFESPESPNEAVKKPNKVFKFKKSSNPQIINSRIESDSIKLAPLEKEESLPSLDESSQKNSEDKSSTIKKFKLKKSSNLITPIKDDKQEELQNT